MISCLPVWLLARVDVSADAAALSRVLRAFYMSFRVSETFSYGEDGEDGVVITPPTLTTSTTCWAAIRPPPLAASLCFFPSVLELRFIFLSG